MRWRDGTERPSEIPATAIIAVLDPEIGERHLLSGIYTFTCHHRSWWSEDTGEGIGYETFWWMPEDELLAATEEAAHGA